MHYNVVIATPGKDLDHYYVASLIKTTKWLNQNGYTYHWTNVASSFIPSGRELTALDNEGKHNWETNQIGSGKYTYDKIFWIDSDISWEPQDFQTILESDKEVVGGLYLTSLEGTVAVAKYAPDGSGKPAKTHEKEFFMVDQETEVFGIGFGFVAMKSGVFEKMKRPWFKIREMEWDYATVNVGEDYSWSMNARDAGIKTYVNPTVKVKHHKNVIWEVP